ncbi:MAG: hypothetical protein NZ522_08240, partial [Chitinophagales bacterium]|nr:hypothetical protein [Chitinophagales bacterium]
MRLGFYTLLVFIIVSWAAKAQRVCTTHDYHEILLQEDIRYKNERDIIESFYEKQRSFKDEFNV